MQIRLTVLAPRSGQTPARACDVLVTAPPGTALATVASSLAAAVSGPDSSLGGGAVALFAGRERLDAQRCALGEPPLVDGAVLSLQVPGEDEAPDDVVPARLHVIAGPDAGGVHLLHGGKVRIGRSADADVPLDDPDVSRLHCTVTVSADGLVSVADLGSTNGTLLDGAEVRDRPVRLKPGALLRLGESTLRLVPGARPPRRATTPDGEGHLRVSAAAGTDSEAHGSGHGYAPVPAPGTDSAGRGPHEGDVTEGADTRRQPLPLSDDGMSRRGGIGAWARRLAGSKGEPVHEATPDESGADQPYPAAASGAAPEATAQDTWPDPAAVLLTALGPGPRLWERDTAHPEALVVRVGTTDRTGLPAAPVTVGLREAGSLGLAGPRSRLAGLARSVVAQLAALHSPADLEIVLISTDRSRSTDERRLEWSWLGWLPHLRPLHGQDCRLLLAYDREQAVARTTELVHRLDTGPLGPGWASLDRSSVAEAAGQYAGPYTVLIVDGDPGTAELRENTARLAVAGAAAGIHLICLAETPAATPTSPVAATYEAACHASIAFRECGAVAMLSGDVATALRLLRPADGRASGRGTVAVVDAVSAHWAERFGRAMAPLRSEGPASVHGRPVSAALPPTARLLDELGLARATPASLMARWASTADDHPGATVRGSGRWAGGPAGGRPDAEVRGSGRTEHPGSPAARVGAQRTGGSTGSDGRGGYVPGSGRTPYPGSENTTHVGTAGHGLLPEDAQETRGSGRTPYPAAPAPQIGGSPGGTPSSRTVPGSGSWTGGGSQGLGSAARTAVEPHPDTAADALPAARPEGGAAVAAGRPVVVLGAGPRGPVSVDLTEEGPHLLIEGPAGSGRTELLRAVAASLAAAARPDRLGLLLVDGAGGERGESLRPCTELPHAFTHLVAADPIRMREFAQALGGELKRRSELLGPYDFTEWHQRYEVAHRVIGQRPPSGAEQRSDLASPTGGTLRLRTVAAHSALSAPCPLPRLVVLVDDFDALVAPALGSPGRPAAGSVVRALEAVAREGGRLGVHLVATSARPDRTEDTDLAQRTRLRIVLDAPVVPPSPGDPAPGRGRLGHPDGRVTPFQGGRVTGRIPRTATLRPTVVPLEWERMGDPPARRPVRELGNGPTDLALLASALERAARSVNAEPIAPFGTGAS
ncbi:FHA domain-containing protein [Streptomyces sp. NPDC052052]|uniref:FHA domain-containing protein n=1 Tax=Streptomyces sp. NPDC052052 TaxID=3154756 RepID=UPI0034432AA0